MMFVTILESGDQTFPPLTELFVPAVGISRGSRRVTVALHHFSLSQHCRDIWGLGTLIVEAL